MTDSEIIFSAHDSLEGGYGARAVGHSIFTQAKTMDELKANAEDAVRCHFAHKATPPTIRLVEAKRRGFRLGSAKGDFTVPDDFNDPLTEEIEDLFWE